GRTRGPAGNLPPARARRPGHVMARPPRPPHPRARRHGPGPGPTDPPRRLHLLGRPHQPPNPPHRHHPLVRPPRPSPRRPPPRSRPRHPRRPHTPITTQLATSPTRTASASSSSGTEFLLALPIELRLRHEAIRSCTAHIPSPDVRFSGGRRLGCAGCR